MTKIARMGFSKIIAGFFVGAALTAAVVACDEPKGPQDTPNAGTIHVSVDETYRPVMQEQMKIFDSSFPNAHVVVHYKPESECITDLYNDKARVILVTRQLSKSEKSSWEDNRIATKSDILAKDAVAVVVNPQSADSTLNLDQIKGILTGVYKKKYTVVFDNQGSSTLRFINKSLLREQKLGANVFAAKGNKEVVDYVATNPDAIGFIGLSYVSDDADTVKEGFLKKVKVAAIQNDSTKLFYMPYQAYIALKLYPFTRNLYYISRETHLGLGTGFVNFLSRDQGQLIFAHARLFPMKMNIVIRDANINNGEQ